MKLHANARTCPRSRRLAVDRVEREGWTLAAAASAAGVSVRTVSKWRRRYREEGELGLLERVALVLFLKRFYVLFFIELATRRAHLAGITTNPNGGWVTQQARNLVMQLDNEDARPSFLVRDRDSKFNREFDEVFRSEGIRVIKAPVRAPKARAHAERWVGSVRRECLDRLLIVGRRLWVHKYDLAANRQDRGDGPSLRTLRAHGPRVEDLPQSSLVVAGPLRWARGGLAL